MVVECCLQLPTWPPRFSMADCVEQSCFIPSILLSSNCTESGKRAKPCKECEWLPSDQDRDIQTIDYCAHTVYRAPPFMNLLRLVHKQPSLLQNLAEWYLQHCLRFLAPALMLFPLALATTSRVWSGRSYIYKIADWRSDWTLQASILSVAQKQS